MEPNQAITLTQNIRDTLKAQTESLVKSIKANREMAEMVKAPNADESFILTLAGFDDPEPMAGILHRISRLRREAADASDEFRRELVAAAGRIMRDREGEE